MKIDNEKLLLCFEDITERAFWPSIQEALNVRLPFTRISFDNKFKKSVAVEQLDLEFLPLKHHRVQRLKQHQSNATSWFRFPYCNIIIVTAHESADYKSVLRPRLNALLNGPRGTMESLCETLIVYVRPPEMDMLAKGPKRVFEKIRDDFNPKKWRERCVRLDLYNTSQLKGGQNVIAGLEELETIIKDCIKTAFQTRQSAYDEEARKLMTHRMDMKGSFGTLFLVKDSLALMLVNVGLLEDALREYSELEAVCLEALGEGGSLHGQSFGGDDKGDDVATLMTANWKTVHQAVLANKQLKEFNLRQYLFAAQASLLFKLKRPSEVVDRGLKFIHLFSKLIAKNEESNGLRSSIREVWAFSACLSVASIAAKYHRANAQDLQDKESGPWYGGGREDSPEKARIELSEIDWDVGVCGLEDVTADLDFDSLGGNFRKANNRHNVRDVKNWHFFSSLGHLYASAREELKRIFNSVHTESESNVLNINLLPAFTPVCLSSSRTTSMDSTRLSSTLQRTSSLARNARRASRVSVGSEAQFYDAEGMPSWMTRAGLASTPKHSRKSTTLFVQTEVLNSSPRSDASFISINSETPEESLIKDESSEVTSIASVGTTRTQQTDAIFTENAELTFHSVEAGSSKTMTDSIITSLELPDTSKGGISPRSLASHALGGSAYNPEASSDSFQGSSSVSTARIPDGLKWLSDWRIRQALSSDESYEDLFVELTLAAAWCYARCGRLRTSALLRVDVAPLLLSHGQDSTAQQLYHMKCDMYLREGYTFITLLYVILSIGWHVLSSHVLPQLSACLKESDPKTLMATCLTYLSLPKDCVDSETVTKMMEDFKASAEEIGKTENTSHGSLITSPAIQVTPKKSKISVLYEERDGRQLLAPTPVERGQNGSALALHAGDVAEIEVEVHSQLPEEIVISNVVLCLSAVCPPDIHELYWASSSMMDSSFAQAAVGTAENDPRQRRTYRSISMYDVGIDKLQKSSMQLFCSLDQEEGEKREARIVPGVSILTFQCSPTQEGIYSVLYLSGEYLGTPLCLPLISTEPERTKPSWQNVSAKRKSGFIDVLDSLSDRLKECVVLQVKPALQRVGMSLIAPEGCLASGQHQWLGIMLHTANNDPYMRDGKVTLSFSKANQETSAKFSEKAKLVNFNEGEVTENVLDDWVKLEGGVLPLSNGFLKRNYLVIWIGLDLSSPSQSQSKKAVENQRTLVNNVESISEEKFLSLDVQLDYLSGCWRSHSSLLKIPVVKPFSFESNFVKIHSTLMLVTISLASQMPFIVQATSVRIELYCARRQICNPSSIGNVIQFPLDFHPYEVCNFAFQLTKNEAKILANSMRESGEQLVPGEFIIDYELPVETQYRPLQSMELSNVVEKIQFPPAQRQEVERCCFRSSFLLDVMMTGEGPKMDLFKITLLPPPPITLGKPVALTWMLERLGTTHSKENISYEILLENGWQCCVPLNGTLFVPLLSNSSATLEAMFIAMSEGDLPAPRLVLTQNKIQSPLAFLKVTTSS